MNLNARHVLLMVALTAAIVPPAPSPVDKVLRREGPNAALPQGYVLQLQLQVLQV